MSAEEAQPLLRMSELSGVFMLLTFVVFVGYGLFAASIRKPRDLAAAGADLDAPHFRRRLRGCWAPSSPSPIDDATSLSGRSETA